MEKLGVDGLIKKEKGLMDLDNSVVIVGWGAGGIRILNGNGKNTITFFFKVREIIYLGIIWKFQKCLHKNVLCLSSLFPIFTEKYFLLKIFFILLLFKYSSLPSLPLPHSMPHRSHPSPDSTPPWFCPCVLYSYSWKPIPLIPLNFCLNFNVSGYILLACLFCGLGST